MEEGDTEEEAQRMISREVEEVVKMMSVTQHNHASVVLQCSAGRLDLTLVSVAAQLKPAVFPQTHFSLVVGSSKMFS